MYLTKQYEWCHWRFVHRDNILSFDTEQSAHDNAAILLPNPHTVLIKRVSK